MGAAAKEEQRRKQISRLSISMLAAIVLLAIGAATPALASTVGAELSENSRHGDSCEIGDLTSASSRANPNTASDFEAGLLRNRVGFPPCPKGASAASRVEGELATHGDDILGLAKHEEAGWGSRVRALEESGTPVGMSSGKSASGGPGIIQAVRDDAYTASRHASGGRIVERDLRRGREAHVFNDDVDLIDLEQKVWTEGTSHGVVRGWDRFTYRSETPIGTRIQTGSPDVPLHVVEVKGRLRSDGVWEYHLAPRPRPAQ